MSYIEIVYAPTNKQVIMKKVEYEQHMNIWQAICISGLLEIYPEINNYDIGVYKNIVKKDYILNPKDRVEIYRPLLTCPKEKRRKRSK